MKTTKFCFGKTFTMLSFIFVLFGSCSKPDYDEDLVDAKDFRRLQLTSTEKKFEDIGKNLDYVVLESNSNGLIAEITKIETNENLIAIFSRIQKAIFLFDFSGKFISKIDDFGDGPGKYNGISDFFIQEDEILVLTNPSSSVFTYDLNGNLIGVLDTNKNYINEFESLNGNWVGHLNDAYDKTNQFNVVIWDSVFLERKYQYLFQEKDRRNNSYSSTNYMSKNDQGIFLYQNFSNEIFKVTDSSFLRSYEILIDGESIPQNYLKRFKSDQLQATNYAIDKNLFIGFRNIFATNEVLFIQGQKGGRLFHCFVSLLSEDYISFGNLSSEINFGLVGEIIGVSGNRFIMRGPDPVLNNLKKLDLEGKITDQNLTNEKVRNVIDSYEIEGNPVLVFFDVNIN
ncbi:6-bladed beta-propeller [Mongoliitalea lutea]|uniref:6-bladed beta-propeller protein n=1 Tax=Mongoliitalea lutea TaxID=849756 RepID=A0A8J3G569_9BACT|nr:6-bladed beta-propeller [Mongoliitalea lutea]GHB34168.1 hypothetical protein GCM10008106_14260 [Mongoliitalea lutea]